jgi:hypothetical protein
MPTPLIYRTNADRQRAYRIRKRLGIPARRYRRWGGLSLTEWRLLAEAVGEHCVRRLLVGDEKGCEALARAFRRLSRWCGVRRRL